MILRLSNSTIRRRESFVRTWGGRKVLEDYWRCSSPPYQGRSYLSRSNNSTAGSRTLRLWTNSWSVLIIERSSEDPYDDLPLVKCNDASGFYLRHRSLLRYILLYDNLKTHTRGLRLPPWYGSGPHTDFAPSPGSIKERPQRPKVGIRLSNGGVLHPGDDVSLTFTFPV